VFAINLVTFVSGFSSVDRMNKIKTFCFSLAIVFSINSHAESLGRILSGAGNVAKGMREAEEKELANRKNQLEIERMNREAEIQKLDYQNRLQKQTNQLSNYDIYAVQNQFYGQLPYKIDNETLLLEAKAISSSEFLYVSKMVNHSIKTINVNSFRTYVDSHLKKTTCTDQFWSGFVRLVGLL